MNSTSMDNNATIVFTDGASKGNPGPGGWGAVLSYEDRVKELGSSVDRATNNQMELTAVISALAFLEGRDEWQDPTVVYTDSMYIKNGASEWMHNWVTRGWKRASGDTVQNKQLWKSLYNLTKTFDLDFKKLPAHSGIPGNVRADEIASRYAGGENPELFDGSLVDYNRIYEIDLRDTSKQLSADTASAKDTESGFYISLVDGDVQTHTSWEATKDRVNGVAGAKCRNVTSKEDAEAVISEWGLDPAAISLD